MAGHGKVPPRQQMINMMYLVYTILMTMMMSNDILKRFYVINVSVENGSSKIFDSHKDLVEYARKRTEDMGNRSCDIETLKNVEEIYNVECNVIKVIGEYKQRVIESSGGLDKEGRIKDMGNEQIVNTIFIEGGGGVEIQNVINDGVEKYRTITKTEITNLALDACDDPVFCEDPNEKDKSFTLINFDRTPLIVALSVLSRYQMDFVLLADSLIHKLTSTLGVDMFNFEDMDMIVNAESSMLPLGVDYRALALPVVKPKDNDMLEIKVNGEVVPFKNGFVNIKVKSPKNVVFDDKGVYTQKINLVATVKMGDKKGTQFKKTIECKRVKPLIETKTVSINKVYKNCNNNVMIKVSNVGLESNINYVGDKCDFRKTSKDGVFSLITNKDGKCGVKVYCDSIYAGDCSFEVQDIPMPTVDFTLNGKIIDRKKTVSIDSLRRLGIEVKPDKTFASLLPKDAKYRVSDWKVMFCKDNKVIFERKVNGDEFVIASNDKRSIKENGCNRFVVEVKGINRENYQGKLFGIMDKEASISNSFSLSNI